VDGFGGFPISEPISVLFWAFEAFLAPKVWILPS
jgi:hypothetical protein